jgi:hypothetical protein
MQETGCGLRRSSVGEENDEQEDEDGIHPEALIDTCHLQLELQVAS